MRSLPRPSVKPASDGTIWFSGPFFGILPGRLLKPRSREVQMLQISVDQAKIADFCRKHHIRRLAFFGSVLRDDFGPDSDVDVLVEFEAGHVPGLGFFAMEEELSNLLGRKVDLNTPGFLSAAFRSQVERESETQYERR